MRLEDEKRFALDRVFQFIYDSSRLEIGGENRRGIVSEGGNFDFTLCYLRYLNRIYISIVDITQ